MAKYMDSGGLSHLMTKLKTWAADTFAPKSHTHDYTKTRVKGNAESSYRTGDVNLTPANIGAIKASEVGNTQQLVRPLGMRGLADVTLQSLVNTTRANRLAFLPADQIIIEKTTDGGTTWVDAGVSDSVKVGLFSETRPSVPLPMLNGARSTLCGLRVTITAMKYNVPANTPETGKYAYWSSSNVVSTERYCQLKEMYFWLNAVSDTIGVKVERANGNTPNNWGVIFNDASFYMTGWSGCDYVRFSQGVFGGGTNQTGQTWNYRITFMTKGVNGTDTMATTSTTGSQSIMEIRAYGDTWWGRANEYMANDKLYLHDIDKNAIFPASILPSTNGVGNLGSSSQKWNSIYATTVMGDVTGGIKPASTRPTSANTTGYGGYLRYILATSSMTTGKPDGDAHVLDMEWDNDGKWHGQLAVPTSSTAYMQWRSESGGTWSTWRKVFDDAHTVPVANGGTGQTTAVNAANSFLNALSTGSSDPVDADYYISQYVNGGTTTTTYHRRPMSALWNYVKGKISSWMKNNTSKGALGWSSSTNDVMPITSNTLAYWNGAYQNTTSNLTYCVKGEFGTMATKNSLAASDIPAHASTATTYGAASTSNYGHAKLSSATDSTSEALAATPKAVKAAYDLATTASNDASSAMSAATGALVFKITYSISNGNIVGAAHVYSAGAEVTSNHADSCFAWSYRIGTGSSVSLGTGKTKTVAVTTLDLGGSLKCDFTPAS